MANFCPNCGNRVNPGESFCANCGTKLNNAVSQQPAAPQPQQYSAPQPQQFTAPRQTYAGGGEVRYGIPAPGYSDRVNDPAILGTVKKQRKAGFLSMPLLIPLPFIGFILYALFTGNMEIGEAARNGAIVSGIFLLFALFGMRNSNPNKTYDAVVTDKKTRIKTDNTTDSRTGKAFVEETEYITVVRTTTGKTKRIIESDHSRVIAYHYLPIGQQFRYHPQFAFPYELYDKSRADGIYCVGCGTRNEVTEDRCRKCGLPLLK